MKPATKRIKWSVQKVSECSCHQETLTEQLKQEYICHQNE